LPAHVAAAAVAILAIASPEAARAGLGIVESALALAAIVWMANLYNFMDGSDGLAGGMTLIGFGALALAAVLARQWPLALACAAIASASSGFLAHNFPPARVFMGDAGSVPLGFLAGALGLHGALAGAWTIALPVIVFWGGRPGNSARHLLGITFPVVLAAALLLERVRAMIPLRGAGLGLALGAVGLNYVSAPASATTCTSSASARRRTSWAPTRSRCSVAWRRSPAVVRTRACSTPSAAPSTPPARPIPTPSASSGGPGRGCATPGELGPDLLVRA
jgi:hypothetical protein